MYSLSTCTLADSIGCALSVGATLTIMVYSLGSVSGGHFNPAVTVAILLSGRQKISFPDALSYIVAQVGGALAAVLLNWLMMPAGALRAAGFHVPSPRFDYNHDHTTGIEMIYSMALCYVVLNTATVRLNDEGKNAYYGMSIGMTVTSSAIAIGPISGCSLNPALSFASTIAASLASATYVPVRLWGPYVLAPLIGAFMAAFGFWLVRGGIFQRHEYSDQSFALPSFSVALPQGPKLLNKNQPVLIPREFAEGNILCCLQWVMKTTKEKSGVPTCDLDLTCVKFGRRGDCLGAVYFAKKTDQGIRHIGDDVFDSTDPDVHQEQIYLRLTEIKPQCMALVFTVMIYSGEHFEDVSQYSLSLRSAEHKPEEKGKEYEICRYCKNSVTRDKANSQVAGMVYRQGQDWYFKAIDETHMVPPNSSYRTLMKHLQAQVVETLGTTLSESARSQDPPLSPGRTTPRSARGVNFV